MEFPFSEFVWPILGSIAAGALIGCEREYRSSPAGCRTHTLVCLSSALLMLAAVHQVQWLTDTPDELIRIDPVRMAHGILTGIGFLCGGVIFREGFTIRGLTTAASLWSTSALGILFGVGFYGLAMGGMLATVLVLGAVTVTERALPRRQFADIKVRYARTASVSQADFRALLAQYNLRPAAMSQSVEAGEVEFGATVEGRGDPDIDGLATALRRDARVTSFACEPHIS